MRLMRGGCPWFAAVLAVLAVGCSGTTATLSGQHATSPASPATAKPPRVPNPFRITARYSASSLGLKRLAGCDRGGGGGCTEELAIGPDGNLYVTDSVTATVSVVSPAGQVLRRWGRPGHGPGQFFFVTKDPADPADVAASIAVGPDGKVYVSDSGNGRVQVFTPAGAFIRQVGSYGSGNGQFQLPYDLVVDASNDLYVTDNTLNTVLKFSPTGTFLWQIGGATTTDPELTGEFHLASVDSHGRIVTTSDTQEAILYINSSGHKVDSFHTTDDFPVPEVGPCNVTVDSAGYTFVTSCGSTYTTIGGCGGSPAVDCIYQFELVYDRAHHLVGAWYDSPFKVSPRFGPHGEIFTLADDGSILQLKVALPGA
jgi:DNA-binding beta-propeller fold protein YncE